MNMKPKLKLQRGVWMCVGMFCVGRGRTIGEAWSEYVRWITTGR